MNEYEYDGLRPSTIKCMMNVAKTFAERSTCSRLRVGAVVTNAEMTQIDAIGYNGGAKGLDNNCESKEPGLCGHIHAENNCLLKSNYNLKNKKIFITMSPCWQCAKLIINSDISEVYFGELYRDAKPLVLFYMAKIKVFQLDFKEDSLQQLTSITTEGTDIEWKSL